ncbi:MAG TPA: RDD family protein [Mycobacteriales bacterium]|nr:RDD family protein [Mycobacteriales bacterium]
MSTDPGSERGYAEARVSPYPESGPGSVANFGARLLAFLIDGVLADVIGLIVNGGYHTSGRQNLSVYLAFLLIEIVFVALAGQTPGMRVVGVAVVRADRQGRPKLRWVLVRTLLLAVVAPALIIDVDGRAMHDRAAGTVMLRVR